MHLELRINMLRGTHVIAGNFERTRTLGGQYASSSNKFIDGRLLIESATDRSKDACIDDSLLWALTQSPFWPALLLEPIHGPELLALPYDLASAIVEVALG